MSIYDPNQSFNDLHWGTGMPVFLKIGSNIVQIRARGTCSLIVNDPQRLEAQIPDAEDLPRYAASVLSIAITDVLGEMSGRVSDVTSLTTVNAQILDLFKSKLAVSFGEIGLQIKTVNIEAIESI